jgi:hypothetical protein
MKLKNVKMKNNMQREKGEWQEKERGGGCLH